MSILRRRKGRSVPEQTDVPPAPGDDREDERVRSRPEPGDGP
jgi:hypothetical protein